MTYRLDPRTRLLVFHPDPTFLRNVSNAVAGEFVLQIPKTWQDLRAILKRGSGEFVAIVDPYDEAHNLSHSLRTAVSDHPATPFIAAFPLSMADPADIHRLGQWRTDEVMLDTQRDCESTLQLKIRSIRARGPWHLLAHYCESNGVSSAAESFLRAAAMVACRPRPVQQLAKALYTSPRSVERTCHSLGWGEPRNLLQKLRVLSIAMLLKESTRSAEDIAFVSGLSSRQSMRRCVRATTGLTLRELRRVPSGKLLTLFGWEGEHSSDQYVPSKSEIGRYSDP